MNIIVTGINGYIGTAIAKKLSNEGHTVSFLDLIDSNWRNKDFSKIHTIVHCAGLVHMNEKEHSLDEYNKVNYYLTKDVSEKAQREGVKQFIFMSSRAIYGQENSCLHDVVVDENTKIMPKTKYAISKRYAEQYLEGASSEKYKVAIIRAPFIYGPECRGNYQRLRKISLLLPILPRFDNKYSMLFVGNLCELIKLIIENDCSGFFMPQEIPTRSTYEMMRQIKEKNGQYVLSTKIFNPIIIIMSLMFKLVRNAFGNAIYAEQYSECGLNYHKFDFERSMKITETMSFEQYLSMGE